MDKKTQLMKIFSVQLREVIAGLTMDFDRLQEIRLRICSPLMIVYDNKEYMVDGGGKPVARADKAYIVTEREMRETMTYISNYSLYAYEDEIRQGFITIQGGHRIGVAGKIILEQEKIRSIKYISFINIRLAHQIKGCADRVLPYICKDRQICHTLIVSPPGCGKTTILRDMIRQISDGYNGYGGRNVGVVDERSEIAACYLGVPQNDMGIRTDILDCCPKAEGMLMMLRSMAPQVIAVDEIGCREDIEAIEYVINCGCKLIATVHGNSIDDLRMKPVLRRLVEEKIFERYVVLSNNGRIGNVEAIFDAFGGCVYKNSRGSLCS